MSSVTVSKIPGRTYAMQVDDGRHTYIADELPSDGGEDTGPGPYDLLLSALGACTAITLLMYAGRKEWPVDDIAVELHHEKVPTRDCDACTPQERTAAGPKDRTDVIRLEVRVKGDLDAEQTARLLEIANRCPMHRSLDAAPKIISSLIREN